MIKALGVRIYHFLQLAQNPRQVNLKSFKDMLTVCQNIISQFRYKLCFKRLHVDKFAFLKRKIKSLGSTGLNSDA